MNTDQHKIPESTYQLRATVRTLMSPAIWAITIWQAVMLITLSLLGGNEESGPAPGFQIIFALLVFGFVYFISGLFRAFATGKGVVTPSEAFNQGKLVFTSFIWLMLRLLILFFLITNILFVISGAQPAVVIKEGAKSFALVVSFLSFVFIYWLPIVFTAPDFRLFKTLNAALIVVWDRLKQSPFPAALIIIPALIAWMMPVDIPLPALVAMASISEIATWIAYVYCIEYLIRDKQQVLVLLGTAGQPNNPTDKDRSDKDPDKKD